MSEDFFKCSKCEGKMIKGFVSDRGEHGYFPTYWVEGELPISKKHNLFGVLEVSTANFDIKERPKFTVKALRCENCGFLESYAV